MDPLPDSPGTCRAHAPRTSPANAPGHHAQRRLLQDHRGATLLGLLLLVLSGMGMRAMGQSEFLQPVAVSVTNGEATQDAVINGEGFDSPGIGSPEAVHNRNAGDMWSGIGSIRESATFDLGQAVSLTKVYLWNYNVADATDVGMKDVEIQVSSGTDMATATFSTIARVSLEEGGDTAQVFDVVGTGVRLVRIKGLSNWGQGFTVGLAEARFGTGTISGNVPYVTLVGPREGDEIALGADILIDTTVTDRDGASNIQKVDFFDGETLLGTKTASPYLFVFKGATRGLHALRAVATDRTGKSSWATVNVSVRELVADRIEKIDDTRDEGTELGQIRYVGAWTLAQGTPSDPRFLNNDHYNSGNNRNDYFELRFKGVKIDVFATVASHHGNGWASIDGGAESKVIYKAAQRAEQVLVWSSPILANREHVLKIRLAGDGVVTADRFDVSVSDKPDVLAATVKEVVASFTNLVVRLEDTATSVVVPGSVQLAVDDTPAPATTRKDGAVTTAVHVPPATYAPGSTHALRVIATDQAGLSITNLSTFTLPAPPFPLSGLGGPGSTAGRWGFRQIWNAGRADAVSSAVEIALRATQAGFTGRVRDDRVSTVNFGLTASPGTPGLFPDERGPLPAESAGLAASDFVVVARASVRIPRTGDWTLGVHSDDGFALRFVGAPFESVSGTGVRDDAFPEYLLFPNPGETITRGVLRGVRAGSYGIEFIGYQRAGAAHFEIYAAEGAWDDDFATDQWQLIGGPAGLEIVSDQPLSVSALRRNGATVTIDCTTPLPDAPHQVMESTDLRTWSVVPGVVFSRTGDDGVRAIVNGTTGATRFYQVRLP